MCEKLYGSLRNRRGTYCEAVEDSVKGEALKGVESSVEVSEPKADEVNSSELPEKM